MFDFPNAPINGQIVIGGNGARYRWDGAKWVGEGTDFISIADAPSDGAAYGRLNAAWTQVLPLTGGTMTGPLIVTATGGTTARSVQDQFGAVRNVRDFGATGNGTTDDTAAIQAAANAVPAAGGVLYIPSGTYLISAVVTVHSNTLIRGEGPGSILMAGASWSGVPGGLHFQNTASNATVLTDSNIEFRDLTFDTTSTGGRGGNHCIALCGVTQAKIINCTFQCRGFVGDAISLRLCYDTLIDGCSAYGFTNCAYDHWRSPTKARVVNCYAESAASVQFINWNPEPGSGLPTTSNVANGLLAANNHLVNTSASAKSFSCEPLGAGTSVRNVVITGNVFDNVRLPLRGDTANVVVSGNTWLNMTGGGEVVMSYAQNGGTPSDITFIGNLIVNPDTAPANIAVLRIQGTNSVIVGNRITGTAYTTAPGIHSGTGQPAIVRDNSISNRVISGATGGLGLTLDVPDLTATGGNARGAGAVDLQTARTAATQVASNTNCFLAGSNSTASGNAAASVGTGNTASGTAAFTANGFNLASGNYSAVLGLSGIASGAYSFVYGNDGDDRGRMQAVCHASAGTAQFARQILRATTTDATPVRATADAAAAGAGNVFNASDFGPYAYVVRIRVAAFTASGNNATCWVAENILMTSTGTAASVQLATVTFTQGASRGTVTGWTVAASADTTNGGINVLCTGQAAATVRFAVSIEAVEVR